MVDNSYQIFVNIDATALEGGNIYIGPAWSDPVTDRIPVFWDAGLTIPAEQPLRTSGGYIVRGGTPTDSTDRVDMLGRSWQVKVAVKPSEDPDLSMVSIGVTPVGARGAAAKLTGFVDRQGGSA